MTRDRDTLEENARLRAERNEAREWVRKMIAETRVLTCAFCGEAYLPGTPAANHEMLEVHVKVCVRHPMREVERGLSAVRDALLVAADGDVELGETLVETVQRLDHRLRGALRQIELAHAELDSRGVPRTWGPNPRYEPDVAARIARALEAAGGSR